MPVSKPPRLDTPRPHPLPACGEEEKFENTDVRIVAAGARKEKLRQRVWHPPASRQQPRPYAELHAASAFSFLDGSSLPEDLIEEAANRGLPVVALVDTNGVYGAPRFYKAAQQAGIRALVGAEVALEGERRDSEIGNRKSRGPENFPRLTLLVENR